MKKKHKKTTIIYILVIVIIILLLILFLNYHLNYVKRTVIDNRSTWDIISPSDTSMSGDLIGSLYEKDYNVLELSDELLSSIFVDYYLTNYTFFTEENKKDDITYEKVLTQEEAHEISKKIFGPDYNVVLESIEYGCNRYLKKENNNYIIGSNDPDTCGLFNPKKTSLYKSFITNYKKEKDYINIELKVAYIEANTSNNKLIYQAFTNKDKKEIINSNYNSKCLYESTNNNCYNNFSNYIVTLKKASDRKYYFYSIKKEKN